MDVPLWRPAGGDGPGIVLIQEIFGLDDYVQSVATNLAALGYVVVVPELFHRIEPGWSSGHDEAGIAASMEVVGRFDFQQGVLDVIATMHHLRRETGSVGLLGFCLGGSLGFAAAAQSAPDAVVSFYGSTVPGSIGLLPQVSCPIQFHFGGKDPYIPRSEVQKVVDSGAEVHVQEEAGHAFHNHVASTFYDPNAAAAAWELTTSFLARKLPHAGPAS